MQNGEDRIVVTLFHICNEIRGGCSATESIESGLGSVDTWEKIEQQAEEDSAESVDDDASPFGIKLNFHDGTLTAANKGQNFSEKPNSD